MKPEVESWRWLSSQSSIDSLFESSSSEWCWYHRGVSILGAALRRRRNWRRSSRVISKAAMPLVASTRERGNYTVWMQQLRVKWRHLSTIGCPFVCTQAGRHWQIIQLIHTCRARWASWPSGWAQGHARVGEVVMANAPPFGQPLPSAPPRFRRLDRCL